MKPLTERIENLCKYDWQYKEALELLPSVKKAVGGKGGTIYATVDSVARSGMSRTISLLVLHRGTIVNLNSTVFATIYGDQQTKDGKVRIHGCGMDMLFEATYRLYRFLFTRRRPHQKHLNRYTSL